MRLPILIIAVFIICLGLSSIVAAQDSSQRTQELIAALDKTKYKSKEKRGFKVEVYVDIKNEVAVKADPREYSGRYEDELKMGQLELTVAADGSAEGTGYDVLDDRDKVSFTLKGARINGALLTGTKVYKDGKSEPFEAVFAKRTVRAGTSPNKIEDTETAWGIGFVRSHDEYTNRIFLTRK